MELDLMMGIHAANLVVGIIIAVLTYLLVIRKAD